MLNSPLKICKLLVKKSPIHGYGVFADQDIAPGDVIEESYALLRDDKDHEYVNYYYKFNNNYGLALGNGSIYNHSIHPNAEFEFDAMRNVVVYRAKRIIKHGEEIFISYGVDWFDSRNTKHKEPSLSYRLRPLGMLLLRACVVISVVIAVVMLVSKGG